MGERSSGRIVLLHASVRAPEHAWPRVLGVDQTRAVPMPGYERPDAVAVPFRQDDWESRLLDACADGAVVLTHSYGGPVAMRAAARHPDLVRGLVLFEPAAYALARGLPEIEDHVRRVQPVLDRAAGLSPEDFAVAFTAAVTGSPAVPPSTPDAVLAADRQRMLPGPWTLDTPVRVDGPTRVVTGGWNAEYEAVAERIEGARHVVLRGYGHRPQDHPDAAGVVTAVVEEVARASA